MHTTVRGVFRKRFLDWHHVWARLDELPKLTQDGIHIELEVCH